MELSDANFTIVGLGLMGGSLGLALRHRAGVRQVRGVARRPETVERAVAAGAIEAGTLDLREGVAGADVVVLAAPVRAILAMMADVGRAAKPGAVVLDLGSTKRAIVSAMSELPVHIQPIGAHPMCGKEQAGIEVAEVNLYDGAPFVLTPLSRTSEQTTAFAQALARAVGACPLVLDAARHDRLVAAVSHLPYLLAVGLVDVVRQVGASDPTTWSLAARGFRDTSRLASSDVTMMLDILLTNRDVVLEMLDRLEQRMAALREGLAAGDEGLRPRLEAARTTREERVAR